MQNYGKTSNIKSKNVSNVFRNQLDESIFKKCNSLEQCFVGIDTPSFLDVELLISVHQFSFIVVFKVVLFTKIIENKGIFCQLIIHGFMGFHR